MRDTPRSNRLTIGFFGRRNAGKSSLINALAGQKVAIVSDTPGTTTDPVFKSMELFPLGPVTLVDSAGLDDEGVLGERRVRATRAVLPQVDLALLVCDASGTDYSVEEELAGFLKEENIPAVLVLNKADKAASDAPGGILPEALEALPKTRLSALNNTGIEELRAAIIEHAPKDFERPALVGDVLPRKNAVVLLVAPQDLQAPKGRLILPQVQVIRDLLDADALAFTVKDDAFEAAMKSLAAPPDLVICDSQVFRSIAPKVPRAVPLTSFSIIMARAKGDLVALLEGARVIDSLKPGDRVLIAEACTHHPMENDIGRRQLPEKLAARAGGPLKVDVCAGKDFPEDLGKYRLILHCGGCMLTRRAYLARMRAARRAGVPITNYGLALGHLAGILPRVTEIFAKTENG